MTSYPVVPTLWSSIVSPTGLRLTLTTSQSAVASILLGVLISFAVARIAVLAFFLLYLWVLYYHTQTILHDQINVLAINAGPSALLFGLFRLLVTKYPSKWICRRQDSCVGGSISSLGWEFPMRLF